MGKKRAKEHYDFIKEQCYKEIDNSIVNTTIHACESIEARIPQYQNNYSVMPEDSVSCLFSLESKDNVAVLNFASYKKPGGLRSRVAGRKLMLSKLLNLLITHGVQTLILGAWGCGIQKLWRNYLWR